MILYSRKECNQKAREIEKNIKNAFGWVVKVSIAQEGSFSWQSIKGSDRYDLYPNMSKEAADNAIMDEVLRIIRKTLPNARLNDYYQSGRRVVVDNS
jgi:hypothetical protein